MTNAFLPADYETPVGSGNYMKFKPGENKFRILSAPIIGWEYWTPENKPVRVKGRQRPSIDPNLIKTDPKGNKPIKHFWAMLVWNYGDSAIQILQITQQTVQTAIENLSKDADWGSPFGYDIKVNKTGSGKDTEYSVISSPKKEVGDEIKKAYKEKPANLEALWTGADPFAKPEAKPEAAPSSDALPF